MPAYSQDWQTRPIPNGTDVAGANFDDPTPEQHHGLGTVVNASDGTQWIYVQAHANIAASGTVAIGSNNVTQSGSTHTARVAFAADEYGWVQKV